MQKPGGHYRPAIERALAALLDKLPELYLVRPTLRAMTVTAFQFSAVFHDFYSAVKAQRYHDVMEKLPLLIDYYSCSQKMDEVEERRA